MSTVKITMLGAGQDVGRSCVVVTFPSRRILFDCGAHCGFIDHRRYPELQLLGDSRKYNTYYHEHMRSMVEGDEEVKSDPGSSDRGSSPDGNNMTPRERNYNVASSMKYALKKSLNDITSNIDCAIISHFHLDHIGALPFLTEHLGYKGPVFMTYPTRGLGPIMLRDSAQVVTSRFRDAIETESSTRGASILLNRNKKRKPLTAEQLDRFDPWGYTVDCVADSLSRAHVMQLKSSQTLGNMRITPYYAGHVLGAAMFLVECDGISVLYTGDFNMTPDKHLGPARVPSLNPDIMICESTYASIIRQARRSTEMELCTVVHDCLLAGGKVLIPVFAVGRAQELAIILDTYWSKLQLRFPIYFGGGLSERATSYYKLHSLWTDSRNIPNMGDNCFSLEHMLPFENSFLTEDRPMVLFATPGMVHSGLSLKACKLWAPNPKNLIVVPGYAVQGTPGNKLISGEKVIKTSSGSFEVKCKVRYLSFSAHADSAGIMRLIKHTKVQPKNLVLVHGEYDGMKKFAKHVNMDVNIPVFHPANGQEIAVTLAQTEDMVPVYHYPELNIEVAGLTLRATTQHDDPFDFGIKHLEQAPDQIPAILLHSIPDEVQRVKSEESSANTPSLFDDTSKGAATLETRTMKDVAQDQYFVISRSHMASMIRDGLEHLSMAPQLHVHRIKHCQTFKCAEQDFLNSTEFIAELVSTDNSYFVEELPIEVNELDNGGMLYLFNVLQRLHSSSDRLFKVGSLEARYTTDGTLTLEWYHDVSSW
eukprot:XP_001608974.1 RNA-metabolising metallo-beta-lactamase and metallo-beta-lactamase superfamily domain containing protein [Babesia bovis T2Bo]